MYNEDIGNQHGDKSSRQVLRLIGQEQRAHLYTLECQRRSHDSSRVAAGNTKAQQRNHSAAGGGVVGSLGSRDAVNDTGAELLWVLGKLVLHGVAHEGSNRCAGAGQDADYRTDDSAAQHNPFDGPDFFDRRHLCADFSAADTVIGGEALLGIGLLENLSHSEKANQYGDHFHTGKQVHLTEGQTGNASHGVLTDAGQKQTEKAGDDGCQDMIRIENHKNAQAEESDGKEVALTKCQRCFGQRA